MIVVGKGVIEWVSQRALCYAAEDARGIGLSRGGKIVAGVVYTDFNGRNVCVHQAIEGRLTREYLWTLFDYPFNQLKVERITGMIPEGNSRARKLTEHLGFELETTLQGAHPSGDLLVYVIRKKDCRWLHENLFKSRLALAA